MRWEKHIALWGGRRPRTYQARVDLARSLGYIWVGAGATRDVYLSPDKSHVVKIQFPDSDYPRQNAVEARFYKKWSKKPLKARKNKAQYAKCKLVKGIGIFMESVDCVEGRVRPKRGKRDAYWAYHRLSALSKKNPPEVKIPKCYMKDETLDGLQLGFTKDNRLVVYDYGVTFRGTGSEFE